MAFSEALLEVMIRLLAIEKGGEKRKKASLARMRRREGQATA